MKKRPKPAKNYGLREKPGDRIGPIEKGAIIKTGKGLIKTALVYPNTYKAGMSSLGFQTVYRLVNQIDNVSCERVFLPDSKQKTKRLKSIESGLSLDRFDMILFSISFENDFIHLVQLLGEAGIPLRSPDRNHTHPLVVAGGVACFLNPEPIAPFIDCFLLGEAECFLSDFFRYYTKTNSRSFFINHLEQAIPGAYVPGCHTDKLPFKIKVQYLENLEKILTTTSILSSDTAFKDTFLIETLKGCPHGCRFCSAGFIYRPPRIYPTQQIKKEIGSAIKITKKIGIVSSAVADHPDIHEICRYAISSGATLGFSSLRADKLDDQLIESLSQSKIKTATIAPEAGSKRMRNIINKKVNEKDILAAAQKLVDAGIINLKLYFMIGLPFETEDDVLAIVNLTKKIKSVFLESSKKKKKIGTITLSVNPFIPKPATPFQWTGMADQNVLKKRVKILKQGLKKVANVRLNVESLRQARVNALLSRGDQKSADLIESAIHHGWSKVINKNQDYCNAVIYNDLKPDSPLPWDFLENHISKKFLIKEYKRATQEKPSPSCPMIDCKICKTCI